MASDASDFLNAWALAREDKSPLVRSEAEALANDWEADASDNGISRAALDKAAGGNLADYLLRVFGESTDATDFPDPAR